MLITRIVQRGQKDVTIHFDNNEILILSLEVFLKSGLRKNDEISDDRFSFFIEQNKKFHLMQRALRLLGRRQHSVNELKTKLKQEQYEPKLIDEVITELQKKNYLDDKKFALTFAEEKMKSKQWSERKLRAELMKKGIASSIISEVLETKTSSEDNLSNALAAAKKKLELLKKRKLEGRELRNKLSTFLLSKGFDYETIKEACDKFLKETEEF